MPYQLQPPGVLLFADAPRVVVKVARDNPEVDLARLEWEPSTERQYSTKLLRAAMRRGVACSTGIVVDGVDLVPIERVDELHQAHLGSSEARAALAPRDALMEQILPGSAEHRRELDSRVEGSMQRAIAEAQQDEEEFFGEPADMELVAHWKRLGGQLPDLL